MNALRTLRTPILALAATVAPTVALAADGVLDLTWGTTCTPLVSATVVGPGGGPLSLIASVLGNDRFHHGHQVRFLLSDPSDQVPDAWRFDATGCNGSGLTMNYLAPASAAPTCPNFNGNRISASIKDYSFMLDDFAQPTTVMRGILAVAYPDGFAPDPSLRHFLGQFVFDHTFSVSGASTPGVDCGGVETPITIRALVGGIDNASTYYIHDSQEERGFEPGNVVVTVNGAVPAEQTTWGLIKSSYRR